MPSVPLPILVLVLIAACSGAAGSPSDAGGARADADSTTTTQDASLSPRVDGAPPVPDAATEGACPDSYLGAGDGCDCGCGVVDPDCPTPLQASDCEYDVCATQDEVDPEDATQCRPIEVPEGWTCLPSYYVDESCTCGCTAFDDKGCESPLQWQACSSSYNGCSEGQSPNLENPLVCEELPPGWTCGWKDFYDEDCDCGCGIPDPSCPANPRFTECESDLCPGSSSPDPQDLTQCISNAPQDNWSCDLALLFDGQQCDCGCGAIDPDCGDSPTAADCDLTHCPSGTELEPGSTSRCWEDCSPPSEPVGTATCTNGGNFSIFSACERHVSACSDGNRYEVECDGGDCVCRVNGSCVARTSGTCSLNFTCGWSIVDNT